MVPLRDGHAVEPARLLRLFVHPVDLELVEALEVEDDRALLAVDLEPVVVLAPARVARGLEGPDRAALVLDDGHERGGPVDLPRALAAEGRAVVHARPRARA